MDLLNAVTDRLDTHRDIGKITGWNEWSFSRWLNYGLPQDGKHQRIDDVLTDTTNTEIRDQIRHSLDFEITDAEGIRVNRFAKLNISKQTSGD